MKKTELDDADYELIEEAHKEFDKKTMHDWHGVSCGIRLASGKIITGLVLEAENPSLTICAEPIVIGKALTDISDDPIITIVATRNRELTKYKVIPPCGRCREFITDYCPDANVIIHDDSDSTIFKVPASDLLPFKYKSNQ